MIIATYNVEFLFDEGKHEHSGQMWDYSPESVAEKVKNLGAKLAEANADVLLLQEVGSQSAVQKVIDTSGIPYKCFFAEADRYGVCNAVLYRVPAKHVSSIPTNGSLPTFGEVADNITQNIPSRRGFAYITVEFNGATLHIIGLHLKANFLTDSKGEGFISPPASQMEAADGLIRSEFFRLSQAKKLRQIVDEILKDDPTAQVLLAGDFNCNDTDSVRKIIAGAMPDTDSALVSALENIPTADRFTRVSKKGIKYSIDDILISSNLKSHIKDVRILNEDLSSHKNIPPTFSSTESDHALIKLEF